MSTCLFAQCLFTILHVVYICIKYGHISRVGCLKFFIYENATCIMHLNINAIPDVKTRNLNFYWDRST